jgi:protein TonB
VNADVVTEVIKAEQMPSFQGGGLQDFRAWVMTQVRFPQEMLDKGVYGRVMAAFVVDAEGSVSNVDIVQTPDKAFSDEVIRVLKKSPKWKAGKSGGKPVSVKYAVPIDFAIHDGDKLNKTKEKAPEASSTTAEEVVVTGFATQK